MYPADIPHAVYCPKCWWSDDWDVFSYGRDYDFSRPFFEQFRELWESVPLLSLSVDIPTLKSSPYTNHVGNSRNCYLIFHAEASEDSAYGWYHIRTKRVFDCSLSGGTELSYDSIHTYKGYKCIGVDHMIESMECIFSRGLTGCQNCTGSANLKNKQYVFFNKQLTKEEYEKELSKWDLGSYKKYQELKNKADEFLETVPYKALHDRFSVHSTGNYIFDSKNCKECYETSWAEDSKYLFLMADKIRNSYDISSWGNNMESCYECCNVGDDVSHIKFCQETGLGLFDAEYCKLSTGGAHHFGCVSIKKGEYCILNKKYSEKEYRELKEKIIRHMHEMPYRDSQGREYAYGEFFPIELSPFSYNESFKNVFFPKKKEEVEAEGYLWRDEKKGEYKVTLVEKDIPDHIRDVSDNILNEVIGCVSCGKGFKIIKSELDFLRQFNLPVPRECPMCRIMKKVHRWVENLNFLKLVERTCDACGAVFLSTYTAEKAPKVLCNSCFQKSVS